MAFFVFPGDAFMFKIKWQMDSSVPQNIGNYYFNLCYYGKIVFFGLEKPVHKLRLIG